MPGNTQGNFMKTLTIGLVLAAGAVGPVSQAWAAEAAPVAVAASATEAEQARATANAGPSEEEIIASMPAGDAQFCLFAGAPPAEYPYTVIKKLKVAKQTYGSVKDVLPSLAAQARGVGGEAIVSYNGSQRFGFFPWKLVRPVVTGAAIKWTGAATKDCAAVGGSTVQQVLIANKPPAR